MDNFDRGLKNSALSALKIDQFHLTNFDALPPIKTISGTSFSSELYLRDKSSSKLSKMEH